MAAARTRFARERPAARIARPLDVFLETEESGGLVLVAAIVAALLWANLPWGETYQAFWSTDASVSIGRFALKQDVRHWVNDGLMVIFFFVVGLEVKRELVTGELNTKQKAFLPAFAAVGGMAVPAAIYLAMNLRTEAASGWAIPMATDIALAIGILALVEQRIPSQVRVLLLTIAIVDDIGAILVIAIFYSSGIDPVAVGAAVALLGIIAVMRVLRVWWVPAYVIVGTAVWFATLVSGIHATIAGVALGLMTPARPLRDPGETRGELPFRQVIEDEKQEVEPDEARAIRFRVTVSTPVTDRLAHELHPWTSFIILPIFAVANAGIALGGDGVLAAVGSAITLGVAGGLVAGKVIGITGAAWVAQVLGAKLPRGVSMRHVGGLAALAGIGFTMSLFIAGLAFEGGTMLQAAKLGILAASFVAGALGLGTLIVVSRTQDR